MSYIENIHTKDERSGKLDSLIEINKSYELNEIAERLVPSCLESVCDVFVPKESKTKARVVDLLSGMAGVFKIIKIANDRPVFLIQNHFDWEVATGFFFFIGTHEEVRQKLLKLTEERYNLKKNTLSY